MICFPTGYSSLLSGSYLLVILRQRKPAVYYGNLAGLCRGQVRLCYVALETRKGRLLDGEGFIADRVTGMV